ncbi:hypothetical protein ACWD25_06870 [Streptomyces sp. NPDC002920]
MEEPERVDEAVPAGRTRRRGRTATMIAAAVVLGVVAGVCTGYVVQAGREPTALPPLSQPVLRQAKGEVEPLSAARDRGVKTHGDLRKLLLSRPKGAADGQFSAGNDGWEDIASYADRYERPDNAFNNLVDDEFRRVAVTSWRVGDTYEVGIALVQFLQESKPAASEWAEHDHYWAAKGDDTRSWSIPGTGDGRAYVHTSPKRRAGYLPLYRAEAYAWRGDVCVEVWVNDSKPISKAKIMDLAERQMGKL